MIPIDTPHLESKPLLRTLVDELSVIAGVQEAPFPIEIHVVPEGSIQSHVHQLTRNSNYQVARTQRAVIVPLDNADARRSVILIDEVDCSSLTRERCHPFNLVSNLLEELLHARIYCRYWQQRGDTDPLVGLSRAEYDLRILTTMAHDEYAVGRAKAQVISQLPLIDHPDGPPGQLTTGVIWYQSDVPTQIEQVHAELAKSLSFTDHQATIHDWDRVTRALYRKVLEPLSRSHAFRAGNPADEIAPSHCSPDPSRMYQEVAQPFWIDFHSLLMESFNSGLQELDHTYGILTEISSKLLEALIEATQRPLSNHQPPN